MAIQVINTGLSPNDGTGDTLRDAFIKVNSNYLIVSDDTTTVDPVKKIVVTGGAVVTDLGDDTVEISIVGGGSEPGDPNAELEKRLRKLEQKAAIFELNGGVIPWSGNIENLPKGWVLCDGSNNTPDLRGRFIVGQDPRNEDYNTIGKTGGLEKVSLSVDEMPKHAHDGKTYSTGEHTHAFTNIRWVKNGSSYGNGSNAEYFVDYTQKAGNHFHGFKTNEVGGNQAHENRPPYYVLAYIMFIG